MAAKELDLPWIMRVWTDYGRRFSAESGSLPQQAALPKSATTKLMHRSNDEAMSSFRQACGLQSPGGYLIAEFWA